MAHPKAYQVTIDSDALQAHSDSAYGKKARKHFERNNDRIKKDNWLKIRLFVQLGFTALILWIGWEYIRFVNNIRNGESVVMTDKPPGVEGFLPISSLMELWLWIKTGMVTAIHPAGVVLLTFAIISAFLIRRGFCSWLCPIGTISEFISRLGKKIGVSCIPPRWLDIVLRSLKYVLLGFFLYAILGMSTGALFTFITSDYNRISDIKMLDYFAPPSQMTWSILGILTLLTLVLKNFWCRYLCPYGALIGIASKFSPVKIRRNADTCIDCDLCEKACPSYLPVARSASIGSEECLACQQCVAVCPVKDCLAFSAPKNRFTIKPVWYAALFVFLFLGSVAMARISGYWYGTTSVDIYRDLAQKTDTLDHPRSISEYK